MNQDVFFLLQRLINEALPLLFFFALPVIITWMVIKHRTYMAEKRSEIVLAAMDKNSNLDIQDFLQKLNPPAKSLKERLVIRLQWQLALGGALTAFGCLVAIFLIYVLYTKGWEDNLVAAFVCIGTPTLGVGIGLLAAYHFGKRMLKHEIEMEEKSSLKSEE